MANPALTITTASPVTIQPVLTKQNFQVSTVWLDYANSQIIVQYVGIAQQTVIPTASAAAILTAFASSNLTGLQNFIQNTPPSQS